MSDIFGQQIQDIRRDFLTNNRVGRVIVCSRYIPLLQRLREHPPDLLTMVEQITNCLHALFHDAHILHHDVSAHNIMWQPSQSPKTEGKFVLCDFDLAVVIEGDASAPTGNTRVATATHRTGTLPFLAIELIKSPETLHRLYHDYESLFWVVLWCAMKADYYEVDTDRKAIDALLHNWESINPDVILLEKKDDLVMSWDKLPVPRRFQTPKNKNLMIRFQALINEAPSTANKVQLEEEDEPGGKIQDHGDIMDTIICKQKIMEIVQKARTKSD